MEDLIQFQKFLSAINDVDFLIDCVSEDNPAINEALYDQYILEIIRRIS